MFRRILQRVKMSGIREEDYQVIREGKATVLAPKEDKVFYNPIQQFNRDLSVMGIRSWLKLYQQGKEGSRDLKKKRKLNDESVESPAYIRILEALSATGLRALRYGHEIPQVEKVIANDLLGEAVNSINRNIEYNELQEKVEGNLGDAIKYMSTVKEKFHVIDLDPYGTATPFIDLALQAIKEDGMLLVTCTDAGVLAGSGYPEKCFALYGGNNFGNTFMGNEMNHEVGLRLILGTIAREAAKYKKTIEPMLSLSIDFYFRLFIRVKTSPIEVKNLASKTMITYHCSGCGQNKNQYLGRKQDKKYQTAKKITIGENCEYCQSYFNIAGPMWGDKIQNEAFIKQVLQEDIDEEVYKTRERIRGMLTLALEELEEPFYFNLNQLSSFMKAPPMPINDFAKAVGDLGYQVSLTHAKKNCLKTDAPWDQILKINQAWLKISNEKLIIEYREKVAEMDGDKRDKLQEKINRLEANPISNPNLTPGMIGYKILANINWSASELQKINFNTANATSDKISQLRKVKMLRFQENPTKNWGPKSKPSQ